MDALLDYCEKYQLEPEMIKPLITKSLKEKVEVDARNLNYLPKVATLPIPMQMHTKYIICFNSDYDYTKYNGKESNC